MLGDNPVKEMPHLRQAQSSVTCATEQLRHLSLSKPNVRNNLSYDIFKPEVTVYDKDGRYEVTHEPIYARNVFENGELVVKPAKKYMIFLRNGPNGCDKQSYHLRFLGKVSSNRTEAYESSSDFYDTVLKATLTDDEYAKMIAMDEVVKAQRMYEGMTTF